jgi:hypothetical protein
MAGSSLALFDDAVRAAPGTCLAAGTAAVQRQQQQQDLYSNALAGALVLFKVQEVAQRKPLTQALDCSLQEWYSELDVRPANALQFDAVRQAADRVREAAAESGITGHINARRLLPVLTFGRRRLERLRQQLAEQLQLLGVDPRWHTLHDVGRAAADAVSSDSDDDELGAVINGRQEGSPVSELRAQLGSWAAQQPGQDDVAAAIKAGGRSVRYVLE